MFSHSALVNLSNKSFQQFNGFTFIITDKLACINIIYSNSILFYYRITYVPKPTTDKIESDTVGMFGSVFIFVTNIACADPRSKLGFL